MGACCRRTKLNLVLCPIWFARSRSRMFQVITLLLLEYPPLIRRALVARLLLESDLRVLAEADHAPDAVHRAQALRPDVVLLDAQMPNLDVSETVRQLRARSPWSRIVILSLDSCTLARDFNNDALVIVGKHEGIEALLAAIRSGANTHASRRLKQEFDSV